MVKRLLAAGAAFISAPAAAEPLPDLEYVWQALNIIDTVQTLDCLKRRACEEGNPLIGRTPSAEKLIAFKVANGIGHLLITKWLQRNHPDMVKTWEIMSISAQGSVVALNLRFAF